MSGENNTAPFKVAAVQVSPVFLDRDATIDKACELIAEAGREGARLIVFPEAFIPAYPDWVWKIPSGEEEVLNELYAELLANSVTIPDDATERLCQQVASAWYGHRAMGVRCRSTILL